MFKSMTKKQKKSLYCIITTIILIIVCRVFPFDIFKNHGKIAEMLFYLIPYLVAGYSVVVKAIKNICRGLVFDENFLMAVASIGSFFGDEPKEAVMVVLLYRIGTLFESVATERSLKSTEDLVNIVPEHVNVLREGNILAVDPDEVLKGETIIVKSGERIALDGQVIKGAANINTSSLTGESVSIGVTAGDRVISGSVILDGELEICTDCVYEESTVGKMIELIEDSSDDKAKSENFISKFAAVYTPIVVISAIVLAVIPPVLGIGTFSIWIKRALTFLVVSCPCALVISVPLSFFGGMGGASKKGILIKSAKHIENLAKAKTVVFNKTGALIKGSLNVEAIHPEKITQAELLRIAASAEGYSSSPISVSLVNAYGKLPDSNVSNINEIPGDGISAVVDGRDVLVGNDRLMELKNIKYHSCHLQGTVIHVAVNGEYMGHIVIKEEIQNDSVSAIETLRRKGIKTVMLTGDNDKTAKSVANDLKIDEVYSRLLPEDKQSVIKVLMEQKAKNSTVAFVGDGINDTPAMLKADVGISMGAMGSNTAIESADIVIMDDSALKVASAVKISKRTMSIVRQNIFFSIAIKVAVLVLGAMGIAGMEYATFADVGVLILAILNSFRTMKV